jgi:hypothetical protein
VKRVFLFAAFVGALLLSACGGSSEKSYMSVEQMSAALAEGGAPCEALEKIEPAAPGEQISSKAPAGAQRFAQEAAACDMGGGRLQLFTFADEDSRDRWMDFGERLGRPLVSGQNWAVLAPSEAAADNVREALGGDLHFGPEST